MCEVVTCRSPLLSFGNVQNLVIQCENGNFDHPGNTFEILIKFIINASQYCSTQSEAPPSSGAIYFNAYEAFITTIQSPVYVATWLLNWFKGFSLWDLNCVLLSIKLDESGHVECSVMCLFIQADPQSSLHSVGTKVSL